MIKAICFDLDGTLVDYRGDFRAWLLEGATKLGLPFALHEQFVQLTSKYTRSLADSLEITKQSLTDLGLEHPEMLEQLCQQNARQYAEHIELIDGAIELLHFLQQKEIPLAVLTNGPTDMQRLAIQKVNLETYFKAILISGELGIRKPDSRIFQLACERLDVSPEYCLMVGDNLTADIEGAKSIGMQGVWTSKEHAESVKAFSNLHALRGWLETQLEPDHVANF
jgi:putative hydrolase of the HAD superfamily